MQPTLDEFKGILSGMRTASPQNVALSVYEQIGLQSSAEHAVGSYLHVSSYIRQDSTSTTSTARRRLLPEASRPMAATTARETLEPPTRHLT